MLPARLGKTLGGPAGICFDGAMCTAPCRSALWAWTVVLAAACATPVPVDPNPALEIPHFQRDDPRVSTPGAIGKKARAWRRVDGTQFTLMAYSVEDEVALEARVEGPFVGTAHFLVGSHRFAVDFPREHTSGDVAVAGDAEVTSGSAAVYRAMRAVEVVVPAAWFGEGSTELSLSFARLDGGSTVLPGEGRTFAAAIVPAPGSADAAASGGASAASIGGG